MHSARLVAAVAELGTLAGIGMTELNTIYNSAKKQVGTFRHGVAWSRDPRERLGEYAYGDEGAICDNQGKEVARFKDCHVTSLDGTVVGKYVEVPFSEFSGEEVPQLRDSKIKRLEVSGRVVGWCIGNPGSACAAIFFMFARCDHVPTAT